MFKSLDIHTEKLEQQEYSRLDTRSGTVLLFNNKEKETKRERERKYKLVLKHNYECWISRSAHITHDLWMKLRLTYCERKKKNSHERLLPWTAMSLRLTRVGDVFASRRKSLLPCNVSLITAHSPLHVPASNLRPIASNTTTHSHALQIPLAIVRLALLDPNRCRRSLQERVIRSRLWKAAALFRVFVKRRNTADANSSTVQPGSGWRLW